MSDFAVAQSAARAEIRHGLLGNPPSISPKFFYDPVGSDLFEQITRTPEYYLTATEIGILENNLKEIAAGIGPRAVLAEIAAGSARKARIVLGGLNAPAAYAPVDIAEEMASPDSPAAPDSPPAPDGGLLTLASFVPPGSPDGRRTEQEERLAEERTELPASAAVDTRILTGAGVAESILGAADEFDAVMVGASEDSFSNRILFGTIPERIAREAPGAVMVLKSHERVKAFLGRVAAD